MYRKIIFIITGLLLASSLFSQKKFEVPEVYYKWNNIQNAQISNDGKVITYEVNKLKGDGYLHIHIPGQSFHDSIPRGGKAKISANSKFVAFRIKPQYDTLKQRKLSDVPKEKFPNDSLGVFIVNQDTIVKFPEVKSFKTPDEKNDWVAWLHEKKEKEQKKARDSTANDTTQADTNSTKQGKKLVIWHPESDFKQAFPQVISYKFSKNGKKLIFTQHIKHKEEKQDTARFWEFDTESQEAKQIFEKAGKIKQIATDRQGDAHAFIFTGDTTEIKDFQLFLNGSKIADSTTAFLPDGWQISKHSTLNFSKNGERVLFETAPIPEKQPEDTLTKEEKYNLDIWHWQDKKLQSQQKRELKKEKKRDYKGYYDLKKEEFLQLENKKLKQVKILRNNNSSHAFGFNRAPYQRQVSWTGKRYRDIYHINLKNNKRKRILTKHSKQVRFSPDGKYIAYYQEKDSCWYSYNIKKDAKTNLTKELDIPFYNTRHDMPINPGSYGAAGWDKKGNIYIYDKYDIWKIDASGKKSPINLTNNSGREKKIRFRYIKTDPEKQYLPEEMLLSVFNRQNKNAGYATCTTNKANKPELLHTGAFKNYRLKKAKNAKKIIFRKGNFKDYPEVFLSDISFQSITKLSEANPQQENYLWGTVESTNWTDNSGDSLSGLIYKPETFDPKKDYPMIVYFYERYSDNIHNHYIPKPSHSVINFTRYINDGYIIFIPDINYKTGYPGESAEEAVLSGTLHMLDQGYIDKERIGVQGQSWGGYQVAHLVTRTNIFSAAMAGAPVVNMTSAYGGIRWGSGMSRAFQYEQTQSRIGGSLWEKPMQYIENSPLFFAPKVETPLLMMHNSNDGAVPWYQGIEFFNALRRLNKETYLLVYKDKHNLRHWGNRVDLSIRMKQFFDYYLKNKPIPEWMKEGLPAIKKDKKTGYKLMD
ncbi:MAG: prolyl oligopeptidase family serine peptidase [Bacteroidales bacterium]|nr:prolyl oligopeptidase family serine peptidase [Bacteroidales bacterium]